jgi:hypothetical protein
MGAPLTKEEILAAPDVVTERVSVPQWGGDVYIRSMSADERDAFEALTYETRGKDVKANLRGIRARLLAFCLADAEGTRLFDEADILALGKKNAAAVDKLWSVARRLNAMDQRDVEELAGNSEPGRSGATPSDSPSGSAA